MERSLIKRKVFSDRNFTAHVFFYTALVGLLFYSCPIRAQNANSRIIPQPQVYHQSQEIFHFTPSTTIAYAEDIEEEAVNFLRDFIAGNHGLPLSYKEQASSNTITLTLDTTLVPQKEGYHLLVTKDNIEITGHDPQGVFYGIQSLLQLIARGSNNELSVQGCQITDAPRFGYRGMHLDVSRHLFSVSFIKKYIDLLAFYKFNTFHWHLTDDQGWRIEIKKYPKLQTIAAFRDETIVGHKKELPHRFDGKRYGGYYTQEEVKEIVQYAADRYVTIIPEIEMPGHASAALAAYPELGCTGGPYKTATFWGIFDAVFCAGSEATFLFLEGVLDEVMAIFPARYIHVGGDECPKVRWKSCPKCQKRMVQEGLKNEQELQRYFVRRIEKYLNSNGRQLIGWDEILEGGLSPSATVMSWRGEAGGIEAAKQKNDVIMVPDSHVYFDYYQSLSPLEPVASAGYTPLSKVYGYDPIPDELADTQEQYIKGVQGAVWSEYLSTEAQAEYMMFPRIIALAEVAWTRKEQKDYVGFLERLDEHRYFLDIWEVNYFKHYNEVTYSLEEAKNGGLCLQLFALHSAHALRYTLDGSAPTAKSPIYEKPLVLNSTCSVKAKLFKNGIPQGRLFQKDIIVHKATGKDVHLKKQPSGGFNAGPFTLVNGLQGSSRYNEQQWLGFSGDDFEAVIDLGSIETIEKLGANILVYHWQRMWAPAELLFYASEDGKAYQEIFGENKFPRNGINQVRATINPVKARYIKVVAKNKGLIPTGEYGAGGKAWLMIDEILID